MKVGPHAAMVLPRTRMPRRLRTSRARSTLTPPDSCPSPRLRKLDHAKQHSDFRQAAVNSETLQLALEVEQDLDSEASGLRAVVRVSSIPAFELLRMFSNQDKHRLLVPVSTAADRNNTMLLTPGKGLSAESGRGFTRARLRSGPYSLGEELVVLGDEPQVHLTPFYSPYVRITDAVDRRYVALIWGPLTIA